MPRLRHFVSGLFLVFAGAAIGVACGTDAVGTDACRRIEQARCRKAVSCPELGLPSENVDVCVQFARNNCLHGLPVGDPGPQVVDPCVKAIEQATTCEIVASPETSPACAFLKPTPDPVDAGADTSTEDAAITGDDGSTGEGG